MRRSPSGREFLLKGKDQYGWPPWTSSDRRWFRSAASNTDLFFFFLKTSSLDEEVNRTEPSPLVRVPCLGSYQNALNNQRQRIEHFLTQKYKKNPKRCRLPTRAATRVIPQTSTVVHSGRTFERMTVISRWNHHLKSCWTCKESITHPGNPNYTERLSTIDLHIKVACFIKK